MRYICPECGGEIPEDSEFCHHCGRKRDNTIRLDESGHFVEPEKNKCATCGAEMSQNDAFCPNCGQPISRTQATAFRPKMVKYGWIGIALALSFGLLGILPSPAIGPLPGLFSIFGLGHFYFKKWSRGLWYLFWTALLFMIKYLDSEMSIWYQLLYIVFFMFVYFMQAMEVITLAFTPPKTAE